MKKAFAIVALLSLVGCAGLANSYRLRASTGRVPCTPAEMTIIPGSTNGMGDQDWQVLCQDRTFQCSQTKVAGGLFGPAEYSYSCVERD